MFNALRFQIPAQPIARVYYYDRNKTLRVRLKPMVVDGKTVIGQSSLMSAFNDRAPALMQSWALNAVRFYQTGDICRWSDGSVVKMCENKPWWADLHYNKKHPYKSWNQKMLPLFLKPESSDFKPFLYQHMAFLVDDKYVYVFTQERERKNPQQSVLYCTCVDYERNSENIRKILACWQHKELNCNTPNLLNRNAFAEKAIEVSAPYLHAYWILSPANNKTY